MKALFDQSKHTKWYVTDKGEILSSSTYHSDGEVRKKKVHKHKRGYSYVRTSNGNYQVHRLVASAFIENTHNKPCVNHKDSDRHNNDVSNLEWVTHKENTAHGIKHGRITLHKKNESANLKYTNEQCLEVLTRVSEGMSYKVAGLIYSMPYSTVAHLVRGSRRKI